MKIRSNSNKSIKKAVNDLYERFLMGEKLSTKQIVQEYYDPKDPYTYLTAQKRVKGWLEGFKIRYKKNESLWFGCVNDNGEYGIPGTDAEYRYPMTRYYTFTKGLITRAGNLANIAQEKGHLSTTEEKLMLPSLRENA